MGVAWRPGTETTVPALAEVLDTLREKYGTDPMEL